MGGSFQGIVIQNRQHCQEPVEARKKHGPRLISLRCRICHFKSQGFGQCKPHMEQPAEDSEGWGLVRLDIFRHGNLLGIPRILNPKGSLGQLALPSSQVHLFFKLQENKATLEQNLYGVFPFQKLAWNSACYRKSQLTWILPLAGTLPAPAPFRHARGVPAFPIHLHT